ncbi:MAG: PEP-CTERM sorting domain-containing protein [Acidobacteriaceae bacterium]|nr:PEP-CTERM sorting domain-containing protein [Acidobacteriaceae bacterium]
MRKFLFLAGCYGLASCLWAGPIYNYTATSASVRASDPDNFDLMASAPGFLIPDVGGGSTGGPPRYSVGDTILLTVPGGTIEGGQPATVDFGGFIAQVSPGPGGGLSGYAQATANQGSFVLPPNPAATYTFPARITGQFTATASLISGCGTDARPPCDASAVLSIDLPGTLTIGLRPAGPNPAAPYELTRIDFTSVPEPSSIGLWLLGAGMCGTVWLARRNKAGRSSC